MPPGESRENAPGIPRARIRTDTDASDLENCENVNRSNGCSKAAGELDGLQSTATNSARLGGAHSGLIYGETSR